MTSRSPFPSLLVLGMLASASVLGAQSALPNHLSKRVVGDYGYWSKYQTPANGAEQIPYHHLSHLNHAGVSFDRSGRLSVPDGFLEPALNHRGARGAMYNASVSTKGGASVSSLESVL